MHHRLPVSVGATSAAVVLCRFCGMRFKAALYVMWGAKRGDETIIAGFRLASRKPPLPCSESNDRLRGYIWYPIDEAERVDVAESTGRVGGHFNQSQRLRQSLGLFLGGESKTEPVSVHCPSGSLWLSLCTPPWPVPGKMES